MATRNDILNIIQKAFPEIKIMMDVDPVTDSVDFIIRISGKMIAKDSITSGEALSKPMCSALKQIQKTLNEPKSITCPTCKMESFHSKDIQEKYCGNCNKYHDEIDDVSLRFSLLELD